MHDVKSSGLIMQGRLMTGLCGFFEVVFFVAFFEKQKWQKHFFDIRVQMTQSKYIVLFLVHRGNIQKEKNPLYYFCIPLSIIFVCL